MRIPTCDGVQVPHAAGNLAERERPGHRDMYTARWRCRPRHDADSKPTAPANSVLGTGAATANLLFSPEERFVGAGNITLHPGAAVEDKPGLLAIVTTYDPVRIQLTYSGYLYVPPAPFELGMAIKVPLTPKPPFGAPVALSHLRLVVGAHALSYLRGPRASRRISP